MNLVEDCIFCCSLFPLCHCLVREALYWAPRRSHRCGPETSTLSALHSVSISLSQMNAMVLLERTVKQKLFHTCG